jgi:hypothetical protein
LGKGRISDYYVKSLSVGRYNMMGNCRGGYTTLPYICTEDVITLKKMIKSKAIGMFFLLVLGGVWLAVHYLFDKKSAEGLGIYVILILGTLAYLLDRWWSAKRSKKSGQQVDP